MKYTLIFKKTYSPGTDKCLIDIIFLNPYNLKER